MNEEWREILDGYYAVSNLGRVKRLKAATGCRVGRILKPQLNSKGYPHVRLSTGSRSTIRVYLVHRLVAHAFLGPPREGCEVNHIDSDRSNPRLDNLEWVTRSENHIHAFRHGHAVPCRKLRLEQVSEIRERIEQGERLVDLGREFGVSGAAISAIRRGLTFREVA